MMINQLWLWSIGLAYLEQITYYFEFPRSHGFRNGALGVIWDVNSSKMEEPNANE